VADGWVEGHGWGQRGGYALADVGLEIGERNSSHGVHWLSTFLAPMMAEQRANFTLICKRIVFDCTSIYKKQNTQIPEKGTPAA
jgi:hypothetical protein